MTTPPPPPPPPPPCPPHVHLTSLTWWMIPGLPCFSPPFHIRVLLSMQTEEQKKGLGMRLALYITSIVTMGTATYWLRWWCQLLKNNIIDQQPNEIMPMIVILIVYVFMWMCVSRLHWNEDDSAVMQSDAMWCHFTILVKVKCLEFLSAHQ